jgi:anti-anti-sigma factor
MTADDNRPSLATRTQLHLVTHSPALGIARVTVTGEVDMVTEAALKATLLDALAAYHPAVLEVDLSACTLLDCSGIRALFAVHTRATAMGALVRVRHPQPMVRLVLAMTGLLELLTVPAEAGMAAMTEPGRA